MPADVINLPIMSDELEDNFAGATERLLTVHFGVPDPLVPNPPTVDIETEFKIKLPINHQDGFEGGKCAISGAWAPAHYLVDDPEHGRVAQCFADGPAKRRPAQDELEEILGE